MGPDPAFVRPPRAVIDPMMSKNVPKFELKENDGLQVLNKKVRFQMNCYLLPINFILVRTLQQRSEDLRHRYSYKRNCRYNNFKRFGCYELQSPLATIL